MLVSKKNREKRQTQTGKSSAGMCALSWPRLVIVYFFFPFFLSKNSYASLYRQLFSFHFFFSKVIFVFYAGAHARRPGYRWNGVFSGTLLLLFFFSRPKESGREARSCTTIEEFVVFLFSFKS